MSKKIALLAIGLWLATSSIAVAQPDYVSNRIKELSVKYNVSESLAIRIISCESNFKPFNNPKNKNGTRDYSWWQINDRVWQKYMQVHYDLDITMPNENLEAGFIIMSLRGTQDWKFSKPCWTKEIKV